MSSVVVLMLTIEVWSDRDGNTEGVDNGVLKLLYNDDGVRRDKLVLDVTSIVNERNWLTNVLYR